MQGNTLEGFETCTGSDLYHFDHRIVTYNLQMFDICCGHPDRRSSPPKFWHLISSNLQDSTVPESVRKMRNAKPGAAWRIIRPALLASLLALLACAVPEQLAAAALGGNFTRLIGDLSGIAYNLQGPLQIGLPVAGDGGDLSQPGAVNSDGADETSNPFLVTRPPDEPANGVPTGRQLELARMQRDEDGQQDTVKPAPKPEQKPKPMPPMFPSSTQKAQQPNRNTRGGMRIPEHQFRSKFGRQHTFQIQHLNGNRFQTGGFVFEVFDVWPPVFSFGDPFFIDEIDEQFFLFDVNHPGVRTLVVVVQELCWRTLAHDC